MPENSWANAAGVHPGIIRGARMEYRTVPVRAERSAPGRTRDELYEEAKALGIPGRSKMTKDELQRVVDQKRGRRVAS